MSDSKLKTCLQPDDLARYLNEELTEREEADVLTHINACENCQQAMERAAADPSLWNGIREHADLDAHQPDDPDDSQLKQLMSFLAPTDDPQYVGRLGAYEVCGVIGLGSTGIVLKALEPRLNRFVAIKVLSPSLAAHGPARKRFEREGRAVAAVSHEHVVPIYAVDEFGGLPYIVMQYIPGVSLLQRIEKDGPLENREVVRIGLQVALGLSAAHGQGIVHRDVKPANVILENTVERAMVTDFGLARVNDEATMTRSGTIAGTPQYMSPEQARGELVDARSDLFSLGGLMYAACTARPPFRADTVFGIIHRVCSTAPRPIQEINPDIAPWLVALIDKLMSKAATDRFKTSTQVAGILEKELAHMQNPTGVAQPDRDWMTVPKTAPPKSPPARSPSKTRRYVIATAVVAVALVAALFAFPQWLSSLGGSNSGGANSAGGNSKTPLTPPYSDPASNSNLGGASSFNLVTDVQPDGEAVVTWLREEDEDQFVTTFVQRFEQAFTVPDDSAVHLAVDRGDIRVHQTELDHLSLVIIRRIEAASQAEAERISSYHSLTRDADDELSFATRLDEDFASRGGDRKLSGVIYGLGVPVGMNVVLKSDRGDIDIDTMIGDLEAECRNGDVRCESVDGSLWARSQGGDIYVREGCTGDVDLLSIHGDVRVEGIAGVARLRASHGNISVGENFNRVSAHATGGSVLLHGLHCKTSAHVETGELFLLLTENPKEDASLSVANGDMRVRFADHTDFNLETYGQLEIASQDVVTETDETTIEESNGWVHNVVNQGGHSLRLRTPSGTIHLDGFDSDEDQVEIPSLGGSGHHAARQEATQAAIAKTTGDPRPGALVPVEISDGGNIDGYMLYLPVNHEEGKEYPTIVYLQGGYGVGGEIASIGDWGLARLIRDENDLSGRRNQLLLDSFIVVAPHITGGDYHDEPDTIERILDEVDRSFGIDNDRIYVTGLSRGGHGSWGMCEALPNTIAAIAPIGGRAPIDDFKMFEDISIWVSHNQDDPTVDWSDSDDAVKQVEAETSHRFSRYASPLPADGEHLSERYIFTEAPIDRHDAWTEVYTSVQFYEWLLAQSRS